MTPMPEIEVARVVENGKGYIAIFPNKGRDEGMEMIFRSLTKEGAIAKAKEFWTERVQRQERPANAAPAEKAVPAAGMVWMGHPKTKKRLRVPAAEVAKYKAEGYIVAGPRTAL